MKILFGIIVFHMLVIMRAHASGEEGGTPWISTALISALLTGFVVYMLFSMEEPTV